MFTTKHYRALAEVIRNEYAEAGKYAEDIGPGLAGVPALDSLVRSLCGMFAEDNRRFDRRLFVKGATGSIDLHLDMLNDNSPNDGATGACQRCGETCTWRTGHGWRHDVGTDHQPVNVVSEDNWREGYRLGDPDPWPGQSSPCDRRHKGYYCTRPDTTHRLHVGVGITHGIVALWDGEHGEVS